MPLGRAKEHIRSLRIPSTGPFVLRAPGRIIPTWFELTWLLRKAAFTPGADQTIEQCGDGSTRGYRLEYLTTGAFKFTVYAAGPTATSLTTTQNISAESNVFVVLYVTWVADVMAIALNANTVVQQAGVMTAPLATDDRVFGARTVAAASPLISLEMAQVGMGVGSIIPTVPNLWATTKRAQRLLEPSEAVSYVDFGRFRGVALTGVQGHFGDDVTGQRVESLGDVVQPILLQWRADRDQDWSTA